MLSKLEEVMTVINPTEFIENALAEETFDVLSFVDNSALPETTVDIITDASAAAELSSLKEQRLIAVEEARRARASNDPDDLSIADESAEAVFDERINELSERLARTTVTFHVRGLAPKLRTAIEKRHTAKGLEGDAYFLEVNADIIAQSIQKAVTPTGSVDAKWTPKKVKELSEALYPEQFEILTNEIFKLAYVGAALTEAVTVDF